MNNKVTIIMYHYVRDLKYSRYPEIKGLDLSIFNEQIKYLKKRYIFITMENLIDSIENNYSLPDKSVLLTFDDAFLDHFKYVFPILDKNKIQGSFFSPVKPIVENTVLDVHKLHFILASQDNKLKIISEIKKELEYYKNDYDIKKFSYYYDKLAKPSRFNSADVIFIKRLLQVELEEQLRNIVTNNLFEKIVGVDEKIFSKELYMDIEHLKCMKRNGMHIGGHGYNHYWFNSIEKEKQKIEIEKTYNFLRLIDCDMNNWSMCYPYGSYDNTTIELLKDYNCKLAFTVEAEIADITKYDKYMLPRIDTNDIIDNRDVWFSKG